MSTEAGMETEGRNDGFGFRYNPCSSVITLRFIPAFVGLIIFVCFFSEDLLTCGYNFCIF